MTLVNVGHMLCPAKTDPFAKLPPSYLIVAIVHQVPMKLTVNKMSTIIENSHSPLQMAATIASGVVTVFVSKIATWVRRRGRGGGHDHDHDLTSNLCNNNGKDQVRGLLLMSQATWNSSEIDRSPIIGH